ncbi:hypothetical protein OHA61_22800 [Streptomyces sp. NBC_00885]|uniref:hypothetical protein n=1 Tax=Streptomyces sp. NBC_00885 TaxID=2975857 RepID=UPI00386EB494|nr:hypothetical protein OHA61_22800 [Streptomyces sp. NBC_00885]
MEEENLAPGLVERRVLARFTLGEGIGQPCRALPGIVLVLGVPDDAESRSAAGRPDLSVAVR